MAGTCGMMGGRRHKKSRKSTRKHMKGGNGYGVVPGAVIAPGALEYVPNMTSTPDGKPYIPSKGGRRRTSKKSKKAGRRRARKTMKGGGSVANVGYGFTGTGARGIADAIAYPSNLPPAEFPIPQGTR
jgi:hypothetical protein